MGTAYAQAGHPNTPVHLAPALTKCSHHLFLLHISLIDPLLTELSPKTTDDGLLRAVLGCALLAFGCSARTSILRAQRLDCLGWYLCTHSDDLTARHLWTDVYHPAVRVSRVSSTCITSVHPHLHFFLAFSLLPVLHLPSLPALHSGNYVDSSQ